MLQHFFESKPPQYSNICILADWLKNVLRTIRERFKNVLRFKSVIIISQMQEKLQKSLFIKERILQFVENQKIKKVDFFAKIQMTSANFRGLQLSSSINSSVIERIITIYPELNLYWLITGKGEMLVRKNDYAISSDTMVHQVNETKVQYDSKAEVYELQKQIIDTQSKLIEQLQQKIDELQSKDAS